MEASFHFQHFHAKNSEDMLIFDSHRPLLRIQFKHLQITVLTATELETYWYGKTSFVEIMCNYNIFVAKIYDYALIDSFWGSAGSLNSLTSYAIQKQDKMARI